MRRSGECHPFRMASTLGPLLSVAATAFIEICCWAAVVADRGVPIGRVPAKRVSLLNGLEGLQPILTNLDGNSCILANDDAQLCTRRTCPALEIPPEM